MATTVAELTQDIKLSLGYPTINLELEASHYTFAINKSLQYFNRYAHGEGLIRNYLLLQTTAGSATYSIPDQVVAMLAEEWGQQAIGDTSTLFTYENFMWNAGYLNVWNWGTWGLVDYYLSQSYLDLINQMLVSPYTMIFNKHEHTATITPAPTSNSILFIPTYTKVAASALYDNDWVMLWAKAECMEILGHIRNKYAALPGPGGQVNFGEDMLRSAAELKAQLSARLQEEYQLPMMFIG